MSMPVATVMAFVDAGYLIAEGATVHGLNESAVHLDGGYLGPWMAAHLTTRGGIAVRRSYVYDAEHNPTHPDYKAQREDFDRLAEQPNIRLRLGYLVERKPGTPKARLEQKGVDTLLVLDLVRLAQQQAYDTAVLFAGDRDFVEAVRVVADDYSRRVILATPESAPVAKELRHVVDHHLFIEPSDLRGMVPPK